MAIGTKQVQRPKSKSTRKTRSEKATRFGKVAEGSAQIVKDAAALLDEELSAGILAAKRVQQRFKTEKRLDASDFKDALAKFQSDAHELVAQLSDQVEQLGSKENAELVNRLLRHTHDMVDIAVDAVNTGTELANSLLKGNRSDAKKSRKTSVRRRTQ